MATRRQRPTNEHIVQLLEDVQAALAEAKQRDEQLGRDLARLLSKQT